MSVVTDSRAERRRQAMAWALYALLFAVGGFTLWYRGTYNVFPGQSADARVHWSRPERPHRSGWSGTTHRWLSTATGCWRRYTRGRTPTRARLWSTCVPGRTGTQATSSPVGPDLGGISDAGVRGAPQHVAFPERHDGHTATRDEFCVEPGPVGR
jgi:hypothetical protein